MSTRTYKSLSSARTTGVIAGALCVLLAGCTPDDSYTADVDCAALDFSSDIVSFWAAWDQEQSDFVVSANFDVWPGNLRIAGEPVVEGATVRDVELGSSYTTLELVPDADATAIQVTIPLNCGETAHEVTYVLDISGTPSDLGYIPYTVE